MSSTQTSPQNASKTPSNGAVDLKLESIVIPVSDVDRAKQFYTGLGWRLDADFALSDDYHAVQVTPPHSECSILFGKGVTTVAPGSAQGLMLVVEDVDAARADLIARGLEVSEIFHFNDGPHAVGAESRVPGPDPQHRSYSSWASFRDPDGNAWLLQEVTTRLPGRLWTDTNGQNPVADVAVLTDLLREAEKHHGLYEATAPKHHWSSWYAAFMVARQQGKTPEDAARDAAQHMERPRA